MPARDLVQEHDLAAPLLDPQRVAGEARQLRRQGRQLVKVGGEQAAAAIDLVQMLDHRPGQRQPVIGGRTAADLVQDHEAARAGEIEDAGGLDHLDHEGRPAAGEIVGRPDAREQPVDHADRAPWPPARSCPSGPGPRSARSGAGRCSCRPCSGPVSSHRAPSSPRSQSLATKSSGCPGERLLDHRMAAALDQERVAIVDLRPAVALLDRPGSASPAARSSSASADAVRRLPRRRPAPLTQLLEQLQLQRQRPLARRWRSGSPARASSAVL